MQMNTILAEQDKQRDVVLVQRSFRWAIAGFALIDSWIGRFRMNPDGVSYLDMGDQYWKGNWHAALNCYWSPLFSWLTGLMFGVTKPTARWEYPEVHLLGFAIFIATLFCFEFFWRELLARKGDDAWMGASRPYAWALGYMLFVCVCFGGGVSELVTPDMLATALVFVTSGMMLRFAAGRMGTVAAGLFGVLLGIGYLTKTAMLPFGIVVLATMLAVAWKRRSGKWLVGVALLSFMLISIPFIAALSWNYRRFTFGDSGKMDVAWLVNGATPAFRHWQGGGTIHATALHPTRKLSGWPEVYEFATPVAGTYPVWYDPSYWNAGIDSHMHPGREVKAFLLNMIQIENYFIRTLGFPLAALLMMFFLSDRMRDSCRRLIAYWPILVPVIAMFMMYAMVYWEQRYTTGVMLVGCGAVMASMSIVEEERRIRALRAANLILGLMVVCWVLPLLMRDNYIFAVPSAEQQVVTAERLGAMGMKPGDHVALIGDGWDESYWARLEKVTIVAEVPEKLETGNSAAAFWSSGSEGEQTVLNVLKSTGAKAVIADTPPQVLPPGWTRVGNTEHAVYFFR